MKNSPEIYRTALREILKFWRDGRSREDALALAKLFFAHKIDDAPALEAGLKRKR